MGAPTQVPVMQNSTHKIENEIAELTRAPIEQLRQRWRSIFRTEPPAAFGPDLLRRSIAQRLQEQHCGSLSASIQSQLNAIIKTTQGAPAGRIVLPRRIKPGATLVRTWKEKTHRVTVLNDGFEFEGIHYASLSEIARQITGTRWNGPRFFGLRNVLTKSDASHSTASEARHVGQLL